MCHRTDTQVHVYKEDAALICIIRKRNCCMCIAVDLKMLTIKLLFSQWFFLWMVRCFFFPFGTYWYCFWIEAACFFVIQPSGWSHVRKSVERWKESKIKTSWELISSKEYPSNKFMLPIATESVDSTSLRRW